MGARDYASWVVDLAPRWVRAGLEPGFAAIDDLRSVVEALTRRFSTLRGGLIGPAGSDDPSHGYDVVVHLGENLDAVGMSRLTSALASEARAEERVSGISVGGTFDPAAETLTLKVAGSSASGPFAFTLSVDQVTTAILDGAGVADGPSGTTFGTDVTTYPDGGPPPLPPDGLPYTWGERYLRTLGGVFDALVATAREAVMARFVASSPDDALDHIGFERMLDKAIGETLAAWRRRLVDPWTPWQRAGTGGGIVYQLGVFGLSAVRVYSQWQAGTPSKPDKLVFDLNETWWSRFWVVVDQPHPWTELIASDGLIASEELIADTTMTRTEFLAIRKQVHQFRSAHGLAVDLIMVMQPYLAEDSLIASDALTAGGEILPMPLGQVAGYGDAIVAHDDLVAGYYEPYGNPN